jgi:hypothetical protein
MRRIFVSIILVCVGLAFPAKKSRGAEFCVSTPGELQEALNKASTNGEDDIIKVVQGVYYGYFCYYSTEIFGLTLLGGYTSGCASRIIDPANTVLDGGKSGPVLDLQQNGGGSIKVEGFTIQNGTGSGLNAGSFSESGAAGDITIIGNIIRWNINAITNDGGGVCARSKSNTGRAGEIYLSHNIIIGNECNRYGGGVYTQSWSIENYAYGVELENNIIANNKAAQDGAGAYAESNGVQWGGGNDVIVKYNTITNNQLTNRYFYSGGIAIRGTSLTHCDVGGNIIYGNKRPAIWLPFEPADIDLSPLGMSSGYYNDYIYMHGTWGSASGNIKANPLFVNPGIDDYHLQQTSPCIDAGINMVYGSDIEGDPRIVDGNNDGIETADIGADEYAIGLTYCFRYAGSWTGAGHGTDGWYVGQFDVSGWRSDIFRYVPGVSGADVFLSDGEKFVSAGSWTGAGHGTDGWYVGNFDHWVGADIFRYLPGISGADVFLNGSGFSGRRFIHSGSWTGAGHGTDGWYVGDFDGDYLDDIFRYLPGISGADVFLSDETKFVHSGSWTGAGHGTDGWYVGDFNGDNRHDIFRYVPGVSGAQVFLSDGTKFNYSGSWTGAGHGADGWYVGDFNGDGKDDIFRYIPGVSGAQVFLSDGTKFYYYGSWTRAGHGADGWYIGDFNGDRRDDILRYVPGVSGAQVFVAFCYAKSTSSTNSFEAESALDGDMMLDVYGARPTAMSFEEETALLTPFTTRLMTGEEVLIYEIKAAYEQRMGRFVRLVEIRQMLQRHGYWDIEGQVGRVKRGEEAERVGRSSSDT